MGKPNNQQPASTAVAYYRVSTQKQGASGLGLEAQRRAVADYAQSHGLTISAEYTEVETGTRKRYRPTLAAALADAKSRGAVLLIAKLDRLARNVAFISALMESGVTFVACDMPNVTNFTIHILAAVAEEEARAISARTRAALAAAKARGVKLGAPEHLTLEARAKGPRAMRAAAVDDYAKIGNYVRMLADSGLSLRGIATRLNTDGIRTRNGAEFKAPTVQRILARIGDL